MAWLVVERANGDDQLLYGTKFARKSNARAYMDELNARKPLDATYYCDIEEVDPMGSFADSRCVDDDGWDED